VELEISHTTSYTFSQPVYLEPHELRFQPRSDGGQLLLDFDLDVDPMPVGMSSCLDASGNSVTHAWFDGLHSQLTITARAFVRILRENPFDYLLDRSRTRLPVTYGAESETLRPFLLRSPRISGETDHIGILAARMHAAAGGELVPLLTSLNHALYDRMTVVHREEGPPRSPEETWREKCGACRDLAVLFVDACRALGVAARFVSGYEQPCPTAESCDLHAWAEVYIPGGGWRGYDPSRGLAVAQSHVAVAASANYAGAAPVIGAFRGNNVTSSLESDIRVERRSQALVGQA
jgi:transglutaminase-like putative cysteine protease